MAPSRQLFRTPLRLLGPLVAAALLAGSNVSPSWASAAAPANAIGNLALVESAFHRSAGDVGARRWPADSLPASGRRSPLPGATMTRGFQIGEQNWLPGHRGVDLAGEVDQSVLAAADGVVRWVGVINAVPGLSIQHPDGSVSTYQPVIATVSRGEQVRVGSSIGQLQADHPGCLSQACLHWGVRVGKKYLDPMLWLGGDVIKVRLLPVGSRPKSLTQPDDLELATDEPGP